MTYPAVMFVDAPSLTANVRFDCNSDFGPATCRVEHEGFTLGAPTILGDPDAVRAALGFRTPQLPLQIRGPKAAAFDVRTALSRELLRPTNWLQVQLDDLSDVFWLKTYRGEYGALDLQFVRQDSDTDVWRLPVSVDAEALFYDQEVTLGPFAVTQTPDGSYPMRIVLPEIEGDAPTPLRVTITPDSTAGGGAAAESAWLIGCIAGKTSMSDLVVDIGTGDGFTAGTGTAAGTANAFYFGGTRRVVTLTAAEAATTQRLSGSLPDLPLGRYKVLMRYEADGSTTVDKNYVFGLRTAATGSGPFSSTPTTQVTVRAGVGTALVRRGWVDLGDITIPTGVPAPHEVPIGQPAPAAGAPTSFSLTIGLADLSAGTVRIDAFKFIPVSGPTVTQTSLLTATFPSSYWPQYVSAGTLTFAGTFDADSETFWCVVSGSVNGLVPSLPQMKGVFPVADPASDQNLLLVMAADLGDNVGGDTAAAITSLNALASIAVAYSPRKLHI